MQAHGEGVYALRCWPEQHELCISNKFTGVTNSRANVLAESARVFMIEHIHMYKYAFTTRLRVPHAQPYRSTYSARLKRTSPRWPPLLITCCCSPARQLQCVWPELSVHLIVIYRCAHNARTTHMLRHTAQRPSARAHTHTQHFARVECSATIKMIKLDFCINGKLRRRPQQQISRMCAPTPTCSHAHACALVASDFL